MCVSLEWVPSRPGWCLRASPAARAQWPSGERSPTPPNTWRNEGRVNSENNILSLFFTRDRALPPENEQRETKK